MQHGLLGTVDLQRVLLDGLERSDHLVMVLESDGVAYPTVIAVNDAYCRSTGYAREDVIGQPLNVPILAEEEQQLLSAIGQAVRQHEKLEADAACRTHAGKPFSLRLHVMPACEPGHAYSVVMARDITQTLRAKEQQDATQGLLAKVFLFVRAAVAIVDENGRILMANPAAERLFGYAGGALAGQSSLELVLPSARVPVAAARAQQFVDGKDYAIETQVLRQDGEEVPVRISATMVHRDDLKRFRILTIEALSAVAALRVQVAGRIKLVGLSEVKEALGSKWPAVAHRAMATAEHVLRQNCGPGDNFARAEEEAFVICFSDATEEEAAFRAAMIAREIRSRLIGDGQTSEMAHVSAITASLEVMHRPGQSEAAFAALVSRRLNERVSEIEALARKNLQVMIGTAKCELAEIRGPNLRTLVGWCAHLPRTLETRVQSALAALPAQETDHFDLDQLMLELAGEQAAWALAQGKVQPILLDIDFEVFLNHRRTERFVAASQALDERLRQRLVPVLGCIPPNTPHSRVLECAVRLRSLYRALALTIQGLRLPQVDPAMLRKSILVVEAVEDLRAVDEPSLARLRKLVTVAHAHGALVLVRKVTTEERGRLVAGCGVDMISLTEAAR